MADKPNTTRNVKACHCQCVQAAGEMKIPLRTSIDVFYGEPTKLILAMTARVKDLAADAQDEGEDFDPVEYVTGAAENRGWGKYRVLEEPAQTEPELEDPGDVAMLDLSGVEDPATYNRIATLINHCPTNAIHALQFLVGTPEMASLLDGIIVDEKAEGQ